jgi:CheY-like chemotaxis protein
MNINKPPQIVIVEDSDEDFDTVQRAIKKAGIVVEVTRVTSGAGCLNLLRRDAAIHPAIVLMDLNTAGTDGREALASIKADPVLKIFPVVVLSTSSNPKDLAFCYAAGANAYHVKPVQYPDHIQIVIDLLTYWLGRVVLPELEGKNP